MDRPDTRGEAAGPCWPPGVSRISRRPSDRGSPQTTEAARRGRDSTLPAPRAVNGSRILASLGSSSWLHAVCAQAVELAMELTPRTGAGGPERFRFTRARLSGATPAVRCARHVRSEVADGTKWRMDQLSHQRPVELGHDLAHIRLVAKTLDSGDDSLDKPISDSRHSLVGIPAPDGLQIRHRRLGKAKNGPVDPAT